MKRLLILAALLILPLAAISQNNGNGNGNNQIWVRWDIAVVADGAISAGGTMPVHRFPPVCTQTECHSGPPEILLTGTGTFQYGKDKGNKQHPVTGGGTWTVMTYDSTTSGTFDVTDVTSFGEAPAFGGVVPPDNIGDAADARGGTAILSVKYSDGTEGIMVLEGPDYMALGYISVSKGIDFFPASHGFGCTDGYCLPEGVALPIFHVSSSKAGGK